MIVSYSSINNFLGQTTGFQFEDSKIPARLSASQYQHAVYLQFPAPLREVTLVILLNVVSSSPHSTNL